MNARRQGRKLTPRQTRFVECYLLTLNATQAAREAGYSARTAGTLGYQLLQIPSVAAAIEQAMRERSQATGIDAAWVLERLAEIVRRTMQEVTPALDRRGRPIHDEEGNALYRFDAQAANRALELIGRHVDVQAWRDRVEVEHSDLMDRINAGRARVAGRLIEGEAREVAPIPALPVPVAVAELPRDPGPDAAPRGGNPNFRPTRYNPETC